MQLGRMIAHPLVIAHPVLPQNPGALLPVYYDTRIIMCHDARIAQDDRISTLSA